MKQTGEILRKAREQKGLSINEIGLSLKISGKILKAVEEGDLARLPAKTFLRGFVQSYANYLKLDVNAVLKTFQEEMGSTRPRPIIAMPERDEVLENFEKDASNSTKKAAPIDNSETPLTSLSKNNNSKTASLTVLSVLLIAGIIFAKKTMDKYQREGTIAEIEVTNPIDTPIVTTAPVESSSPMSTPMISSETDATVEAPASTPVMTPTLSPSPTFSPAPTPTPASTPLASPTPTPSPTPEATPTPAAAKPVEVIVEALDAVEIEYSTKGGQIEKITLTAEQLHTFKSKNGLRLNISNGGAVNVIVNGKDLGIPGNLGKPVKLNY